jgi:hypothetical protein
MYNSKLSVVVKSKEKVLREIKDVVYVPFGTEYSIVIRNLNSVRVSINLSIDGNDVGGNNSFVVNANSETEITRFIKNGNLTEGNRFKFIERTSAVEKHKGIGIEDGLIRVEFQFEKPITKYDMPWYNNGYNPLGTPRLGGPWNPYDTYYSTNAVGSSVLRGSTKGIVPQTIGNVWASSTTTNSPADTVSSKQSSNDVGVTVPGSVSDQKFQMVSNFQLESEKHVIVLKMLGETEGGKPVVEPVTVKAKPSCSSCGRVNKATSKFCSECGTSLVIV